MKAYYSLIVLCALYAVHAAEPTEAQEQRLTYYRNRAHELEQRALRSLQEFERTKNHLLFSIDSHRIIAENITLLTESGEQDRRLTQRIWNNIILQYKRLMRNNLLSEASTQDLYTFIEQQLINKGSFNSLQHHVLNALYNIVRTFFIKKNFDQALVASRLAMRIHERALLSDRSLREISHYQLLIAEKYMSGLETEKDLNKAQRILLGIVNQGSPAKLETIKEAFDDLFEIFFNTLESDFTEHDLDEIREILELIIHGSFKATSEYVEKARLRLIELTLSYTSPKIYNTQKAREILHEVLSSKVASHENKKCAQNLLNKLP